LARSSAPSVDHQSGSVRHLAHQQLKHAVIEQANEPETLGDRNHLARRHQSAVGAADPHQAFMKGYPTRDGFDHRLKRQQDAPFVQRGDDLVGRAHVVPAQRVAFDVGPIDLVRTQALGLGAIERLLRARQQLLHV
jgi:hypothetical protein